jgi:threonine dehydrogenase-like Zn-dependent dehydrogenase
MLAAVIEGPGAVVVRDTAPPRAAGLALVRVTQAGICGTDRTLAAGGIAVRPPRVLGHEMTGRVQVPAAGGAVPAGTPVVVNPPAFCGAVALALAASERPEHLKIVLDVAGP